MDDLEVFIVARSDLRQHRFVTTAPHQPEPGEVLLKVDRFAFTANNITYAELGERLAYWQFFPAPEGWGTIPVWGFADVIESRHDSIRPGERVYGFLPMATHVTARPERVGEGSFVEASAHRQKLPAAYNLYLRVAGDPSYQPHYEDLQSLLRPLFLTSFLIDDFLAEEHFFGARFVVLSSASSKTAFGLAYQLHRHRRGTVEVAGLTSKANLEFVGRLGCYDRIVTYDRIADLPAERAALFVDLAGSSAVRTAVHQHYRDALKFSLAVGLSHRDQHPPGAGLPGPRPVFFFAPERLRKRAQDWGRDGIDLRFAAEWRAFAPVAASWLTLTRSRGHAAVQAVYAETLAGKVPAERGNILSLWEE